MPTDMSAPKEVDDNFFNNFDEDDPFANDFDYRPPSPDRHSSPGFGQKRGADELGIDEEVEVVKKQRIPIPKLTTTLLLSEKGIPKLQKRAKKLRLKGKGHEYGDAARLLEMYQLWLDDLFPRAKFKDALAMVDKLGKSAEIKVARRRWMDENKPKPADWEETGPDGEVDIFAEPTVPPRAQSNRPEPREASVFLDARERALERDRLREDRERDRFGTPGGGDIPDEFDDLFDASPRRPPPVSKPEANQASNDFPDDDELEALMAEAEMDFDTSRPPPMPYKPHSSPRNSESQPKKPPAAVADEYPDEDELDALMAEAEMDAGASIFGPVTSAVPPMTKPKIGTDKAEPTTSVVPVLGEDGKNDEPAEDELDALMAEMEG